MIHSRHTDEPSIQPATPAAALWRVARLRGALERETAWEAMPILHESLAQAHRHLEEAAQNGTNPQQEFSQAQSAIFAVYEAAIAGEDARERVVRLGFPDMNEPLKDRVDEVDISTVVASHFKPLKQIFTTISFEEAHGATAYWLYEVRTIDGEDIVDAVVENYAPMFQRVRLPVGKHRFVIESRNPSKHARTGEFELEVPAL